MKIEVTRQGELKLSAENQAEMIQLNQLLNTITLTAAAAVKESDASPDLAQTRFITLRLHTK